MLNRVAVCLVLFFVPVATLATVTVSDAPGGPSLNIEGIALPQGVGPGNFANKYCDGIGWSESSTIAQRCTAARVSAGDCTSEQLGLVVELPSTCEEAILHDLASYVWQTLKLREFGSQIEPLRKNIENNHNAADIPKEGNAS